MTVDPPRDDADLESEEALTWDGERDASHVAGPDPRGAKPVRPGSARTGAADDTAVDGAPAATSSFLLVTYGIVAGVYGLYTIGWITSVLRSTITMSTMLGEIMFQFGEFLAIAAAPLWFASTFFLTRGRKPIMRLAWLIVGLVLLVPIPFVLGM